MLEYKVISYVGAFVLNVCLGAFVLGQIDKDGRFYEWFEKRPFVNNILGDALGWGMLTFWPVIAGLMLMYKRHMKRRKKFMATQAVVSVTTEDGLVLFKLIAGCNGYNASFLCKQIEALQDLDIHKLRELASLTNFGCKDCLVVMSPSSCYISSGDPLDERYRDTFNDPEFNPRWKLGTADYILTVKK